MTSASTETGALRCPCRKVSETVVYAHCCGRYHDGAAAPTAETLMRSRYSAFALDKSVYLLATWHLSTRPSAIEPEPGRHWTMLKIRAASEQGDAGVVSFTARSRIGGRTFVLEETSRFVREQGRWWYVAAV